MSGDRNKYGRAHISLIACSFVSINTLDKMRAGALIVRLFIMTRQASYPMAGREADRSLPRHMYYILWARSSSSSYLARGTPTRDPDEQADPLSDQGRLRCLAQIHHSPILRITAGADHFSVKTASVRLSSGRISTGNARAGPLKASALSLWGQASPSIPFQPSRMPAPSFTVIHGRAWGPIPAISYLEQDAPRLHGYSAQGSSASYPTYSGMRLQAMASYPNTNRQGNHPGAAHRIAL